MATTNIHKASLVGEDGTHEGKTLTEDMIVKGLEIVAPDGFGGKATYVCNHVTSDEALFISKYGEPGDFSGIYSITMQFNQPDFSPSEISQLHDAYVRYGSDRSTLSSEDRNLLNRADSLGYVNAINNSEFSLTEKGQNALSALPALRLFVYLGHVYDPVDYTKGAQEAAKNAHLHEIYSSGPDMPTKGYLGAVEAAVGSLSNAMTFYADALCIVGVSRFSLEPEPLWQISQSAPEDNELKVKLPSDEYKLRIYRSDEFEPNHKGFVDAKISKENALKKSKGVERIVQTEPSSIMKLHPLYTPSSNSEIAILPELSSILNKAACSIDHKAKIRVGAVGELNDVFIPVDDLVLKKNEMLSEEPELATNTPVELYQWAFIRAWVSELERIRDLKTDVHKLFIDNSVHAFFAAAKEHDRAPWGNVIKLISEMSPPELGTVEQVNEMLQSALTAESYDAIGNLFNAREAFSVKDVQDINALDARARDKVELGLYYLSIQNTPKPVEPVSQTHKATAVAHKPQTEGRAHRTM